MDYKPRSQIFPKESLKENSGFFKPRFLRYNISSMIYKNSIDKYTPYKWRVLVFERSFKKIKGNSKTGRKYVHITYL